MIATLDAPRTIDFDADAPDVERMVHALARRLAPACRGLEVDDLVQVGRLALIRVRERFDPTRGVKFSTYASHRVRGAMLSEMSRRGHLIHGAPGVVLTGVVDDEGRSPVDLVADPRSPVSIDPGAVRDRLAPYLDRLPSRLSRVVRLRYGWGGRSPLSLQATAKAIGATTDETQRIEDEALDLLRGMIPGESTVEFSTLSSPTPAKPTPTTGGTMIANGTNGHANGHAHHNRLDALATPPPAVRACPACGKAYGRYARCYNSGCRLNSLARKSVTSPAPTPSKATRKTSTPARPSATSPVTSPPAATEFDAVLALARVLDGLDRDAVRRVLGWAASKYAN